MSKKARTLLIKYGVSLVACAVFVVMFLQEQGLETLTLRNQYRVLSDAFTVPGLLLIFSGLMVVVMNAGALDGISFVVTYAFKALIPGLHGTQQSYADYKAEKKEKKIKGYGFLFVVGGINVALSFVFLALFYSV